MIKLSKQKIKCILQKFYFAKYELYYTIFHQIVYFPVFEALLSFIEFCQIMSFPLSSDV
jgi:hypothetical protein